MSKPALTKKRVERAAAAAVRRWKDIAQKQIARAAAMRERAESAEFMRTQLAHALNRLLAPEPITEAELERIVLLARAPFAEAAFWVSLIEQDVLAEACTQLRATRDVANAERSISRFFHERFRGRWAANRKHRGSEQASAGSVEPWGTEPAPWGYEGPQRPP